MDFDLNDTSLQAALLTACFFYTQDIAYKTSQNIQHYEQMLILKG